MRLSDERGDLGTYLAVAMVLPLLFVLGVGGAETVHLLGLQGEVAATSYAALRSADVAGGVTPSLAQDLTTEIDAMTGEQTAAVSGTPAGQPWGATVCLKVQAPATLQLPTLSTTVNLGGEFCGASDLPPNGG